jgi:hypothetical protein
MKMFDAPIPGQSLTGTPGSASFEHPPQYASIEDALEYIWNTLTMKKHTTKLILLLKRGMPVEFLARSILFDGFVKGKWTPDAAMLMLKTVMAMLATIGESKGVKVELFNPDKDMENFLNDMAEVPAMDNEEPQIEVEQEQSTPKFEGLLGMGM